MHYVRIVELQATVDDMRILGVEQQCFVVNLFHRQQ